MGFQDWLTPFEKYKKGARQNIFSILLFNGKRALGKNENVKYVSFLRKDTFLTWIDLNPGFGRDWNKFWTSFNNSTFIVHQFMSFGHKKIKFHAVD